MSWLFNKIFYKNFSILRIFEIGENTIYEYVYNTKTYYSDTWPPNTSCRDYPIKTAVREDGKDVTETVIKFSGPRRNFVNPLSVNDFYNKLVINIKQFGRIRFEIKKFFTSYTGNVHVTDIFGNKKTIKI